MKSALVLLAALLLPGLAWAHPHEWVDWGVGLVVEESKPLKVVSARLEMTWDEWFSALVFTDYPEVAKGNLKPSDLVKIDSDYGLASEERASTLNIIFQNRPLPAKRTLTAVRTDGKQVTLIYTIPLGLTVANPSQLRLSVYDPTYYCDMGIRKKAGAYFVGVRDPAAFSGKFSFAQDLGHPYYGGSVYPEVVVFSLNP